MKKRLWLVSVIVMVGLLLPACAKKVTEIGSMSTSETDSKVNDVEEDSTEKVEQKVDTEVENEAQTEDTSVNVTVYYGNSNADGLDTEVVTIASLTPETLIAELQKKNVFPEDTTIQNFTQSQLDGHNVIDLDLSASFASYITARGTAGERMTMGSIVNTFLDAYGSDMIRVTVDGQPVYGHKEYADYMSRY